MIFVIWFPHRHRRWFIHFYRRSFCRISASLSRKPAVVLSSMWLLSMLRSACLTLISENANRFFQPSSLKDICVARSLFCDCGTKLRLRAGWRMSDEVMSEKNELKNPSSFSAALFSEYTPGLTRINRRFAHFRSETCRRICFSWSSICDGFKTMEFLTVC